jgi:hypothetical protein
MILITDLVTYFKRDWGIEGLMDKINKLKTIEFLQFLTWINQKNA